jgi:hypothetical protein
LGRPESGHDGCCGARGGGVDGPESGGRRLAPEQTPKMPPPFERDGLNDEPRSSSQPTSR